jgi:hypothetical protein
MTLNKIEVKIKIAHNNLPAVAEGTGGNSIITIQKDATIFFYKSDKSRLKVGGSNNALETVADHNAGDAKADITHVEMTLPTRLVRRIEGLILLKDSRKSEITNADAQEATDKNTAF